MKHLIKIESTAHGVLGVRHAGRDQQYCEAGELVTLKWQPDAGWGLKEAHYTDGDGNVNAIEGGEFIMPDSAITIDGTFKKFVLNDWTGDVIADNVSANGNVSAKGDVLVGGIVSANYLILQDIATSQLFQVVVAKGTLYVNKVV